MIEGSDLWELIGRRAAATPELEMACDESGNRLTYGLFAHRAEATAAALAGHGVTTDSVVSWMLPTGTDAVVLAAALSRLGAVQNPLIPIYREKEVRFCTTQAGSQLLIVPGTWRGFDYRSMAESVAATNPALAVLSVNRGELPVGDPSGLPARPMSSSTAEAAPVRWLMYTSGTTADPKGARHVDASIAMIAHAIGDRYDIQPGDRGAITFPVTHIGGIAWIFLTCQRGVVLLLDDAFEAERTPWFLSREGCTHAGSATAFHLAYLAAQRQQPDVPLFPHLKNCPGGGAPKPPELHYQVKRELGGAGVVSGWGLTEAPILTTAFCTDSDDRLARTEGAALPGVELRVVRADETLAAVGQEGELRAKAPQMMRGYVDASLDADAFDANGYFRTGDLGYLDVDGYVVITGRLKDVIIRNGENISAKEIEDLLYTHPAVADVAVVGLAHPRTGEQACAVVVPADVAAPPALVELQRFLSAHGLRTQALPERLELVAALPRNSAGKILKNDLRARLEA